MASTYLALNFHVVFSTLKRVNFIEEEWRADLHAYLGGTARGLGCIPRAINGTADHVHLLLGTKATHSIADVVREVKKASSTWAKERQPRFAWQEGYSAFTVGKSEIETIKQYIANQEEHHCSYSSADEMRRILAEEEIEFDEKYFE